MQVCVTKGDRMPKRVESSEVDTLIEIVGRFPVGASVDDITRLPEIDLPRRTLQRRLAMLVRGRRLISEGRGRGSRYRVPRRVAVDVVPGVVSLGELTADVRVEVGIPLSGEGESIHREVRAPIQHRRPVGYDREFLDRYRPNETFYLSSEIRRRLSELGRSPDNEHPAGTYARKIHHRLLIDLSWNSSRLEGNTYSLLETERLLAHGEAGEDKSARETQTILNHKAAINFLVEQAGYVGFNRHTVLNLHALLADNLLDPRECGRLRSAPVTIGSTSYHPLEIPQLIEECFGRILDTAAAIEDPFEQAFFAMVQLPYLQPFLDVNKRVSRLAANLPLVRDNLCPLSFIDVPDADYAAGILGVYELNRIELLRDVFCWVYERSCARYSAVRQSLGEPDPFRLRYRELVADCVRDIVTNRMDKKTTTAYLRQRASETLPSAVGARLVDVVEMEAMSLHDGNIARFHLSPPEYEAWKKIWRQGPRHSNLEAG